MRSKKGSSRATIRIIAWKAVEISVYSYGFNEKTLVCFLVRPADAERDLKSALILQMLSKRIGEELSCIVSGLTSFGIFVQCQKFGIEGLIDFGDLGMDEWKYNDKAQAVVGVHSGKSVHLGQPMKVKIAAVNIPSRQLNLAPSEPLIDARTRLNSVSDRKKAKKGKYRRRKLRQGR